MVEQERIHFGSLEEIQRKEGKTAAIQEEASKTDGMTLDELDPLSGIETKNELKKVFEQRQLKKTLQVPTDDQKVRNKLRELYEPMTLFGEDKVDRRERLKEIMAIRMMEGLEVSFSSSDEDDEMQTKEEYTYGVEELATARRHILQISIEKVKERLRSHQMEIKVPFAERKKLRHEFYTELNEFQTKSLQFGDERPIGFCRFSPNSKLLATASWSGLVKLWNVSDSENVKTLRGI
jgi:U4/U6 small nuclear ribonucleoprotein PRP4